MKIRSLLLAVVLVLAMLPLYAAPASAASAIWLDRTVYGPNDTITVSFSGTDTNDWTGLYPKGRLPGSGMNSLDWTYTVGSGKVTFGTASLAAGEYTAFLCDNDGYTVLDRVTFTVRGSDTTDYGVAAASVNAALERGKTTLSVQVTPSSSASLTYRLYWARDGVRLADYQAIKELVHSGNGAFTMWCNDNLFMPAEANGIEVAVVEGHSTSKFIAAPDKLKAPASPKRFEFQVITDTHISSAYTEHVPNYKAALRDIAANSPSSVGIFTAGDNTDKGAQDQYDLLKQTLGEVGVNYPTIYYAMGNHDQVYTGTYEQSVQRHLDNLGMPSLYYAVEKNGTRFLMLGSNEQSTAGTIDDAQLAWVQQQLAQTDPETPVFLFLHQPLRDTVSGTLTWKHETIQRWYLGEAAGVKLRAILKNYPNAVLFSGHTHWALEQTQPFLYGEGVDASFMNAASTAYLWDDNDQEIKGSQGLYVEVYEDYILVKGRDFITSQWVGAAQFMIPLTTASSDAVEGDLTAGTVTTDSATMNVESTANATVFYNTDGLWPSADVTFDAPITFDPDNTSLYVDIAMDAGAAANLYLMTANGASVSLAPFIPGGEIQDVSGDLLGSGKRLRGAVRMSDLPFTAEHLNGNGTVTATKLRVYASGDANAKMTVYDLSLVNDRSEKAVTLMDPSTLVIDDDTLTGGYVYDNGTLTVTATSDKGYAVSFLTNETYNVNLLRRLAFSAQSTVRFDVTVTASTAGADTTFGLAADFWPSLCDAKDGPMIPAGTYTALPDLYSCYTFNNIAPADGRSAIKRVTIKLGGEGTLTLSALQLSSAATVQPMPDGLYAAKDTTVLKGDLNGDGLVTTTDIRAILLSTVGEELTDAQKAAADVNGDGFVTTVDARTILTALLGA